MCRLVVETPSWIQKEKKKRKASRDIDDDEEIERKVEDLRTRINTNSLREKVSSKGKKKQKTRREPLLRSSGKRKDAEEEFKETNGVNSERKKRKLEHLFFYTTHLPGP